MYDTIFSVVFIDLDFFFVVDSYNYVPIIFHKFISIFRCDKFFFHAPLFFLRHFTFVLSCYVSGECKGENYTVIEPEAHQIHNLFVE